MGLLDNTSGGPVGLLGQGWDDPRSAAIMNLAGGLIRGDVGGAFIGANKGYQEAMNSGIERLAKQQQIGINNIQLQQAMQKWAWLQDAMKNADQPQQTQGMPNPDAPEIALGQGASLQPSLNLPDGSRLNTGGIGPTNANAQRMGSVAPVQVPVQSSNPYVSAANSLGITPRAAIMQSMMFPEAFNHALGAAITPTDPTRLAIAAGQDPKSANVAQLRKNGWVAPTNIRGFGYADPEGLHPLPMNAPQGSMPAQDPVTGAWSFVPVTGGAAAVQSASQATQTGKTFGTIHQGVDENGNQVFTMGPPPGTVGAPTAAPAGPAAGPAPVAAPATRQPSQPDGNPNAVATPYERTGSDVAALKREIALAQRSMDPPAVKQARLDILNGELAKATAAPSATPPTAPTAASPSGVIRPGLSATQQGLTDQGKTYYQHATTEASNVGTLRQMLQEIGDLAKDPKNKFGPGAPAMARVLALAKNVGIDMTGAQTAQDVMGKLSSNIVMSQLGQGNQTGSDAQMNQIIHANPNGEMTNDAVTQVVPLLLQQLDVRQARANVVNSAVGHSQNFAAIPSVVNKFNKLASPPVVSLGMQLAEAQKSGNTAAFIQGLTPQQRILLPQVKQLDQLGAF